MFIVIFDNGQMHSDHRHQPVLSCSFRGDADDAVKKLGDWLVLVQGYMNGPEYAGEISNTSDAVNKFPLPIEINLKCFPSSINDHDFVYVIEVPEYLRGT